jgi:hypothetical protein
MNVNVDQARRNKEAGSVDNPVSLDTTHVTHGFHFAIAQKEITLALKVLGGVNDGAVLDEESGHEWQFMDENLAQRTQSRRRAQSEEGVRVQFF